MSISLTVPSESDVVDECYQAAVSLLQQSTRSYGWAASADLDHYDALWSRDAAFTALGSASIVGEGTFLDATRDTISKLVETQGRRGQIAAVVWPSQHYWDWGDMGATDSSSLFIIMLDEYLRRRPYDEELEGLGTPAAARAFAWLQCQDANNFGLIDSPGGSDWLDSSITRSGKVLYNNVLYFAAAEAMKRLKPGAEFDETAGEICEKANILFWPDNPDDFGRLLEHVPYPDGAVTLFQHPTVQAAYAEACRADRSYYLSHVNYGRCVDLCDVLANSLAVLYGLADSTRQEKIASYLLHSSAMVPFPARTYPDPIDPRSDRWQVFNVEADRHQEVRWRNPPHRYHNAAVWPLVGGFVVAALAKSGHVGEALSSLRLLADANRLSNSREGWGFHEWIDGTSGRPQGARAQSWSAAAFLYGHEACQLGMRELVGPADDEGGGPTRRPNGS